MKTTERKSYLRILNTRGILNDMLCERGRSCMLPVACLYSKSEVNGTHSFLSSISLLVT